MRAVALVVLAACATPVVATPAKPARQVVTPAEAFPDPPGLRIPHTFAPSFVRARLSLGEHGFDGHVEIRGRLTESTRFVWLNANELEVTRALARNGAITVALDVSKIDARRQMLALRAPERLPVGDWTLEVDYRGVIHDEAPRDGDPTPHPASGVFRRTVGDATYVYTQSEAVYARTIFPCVDEPDRKVPWQLELEVPRALVVAGNTPIEREAPVGTDRKLVELAPTKPLPSYLIAFAVGPFEVVDGGQAKDGTPIRGLAMQGRAAEVGAAVKTVGPLLDELEAWLEVPYAFGKIDIVDVRGLGFGAMENPGLITVDDAIFDSTPSARNVLGHELAHQWFGDLVTLAWWDEIWLNESIAYLVGDNLWSSGHVATADLLSSRADAARALESGWSVRRMITGSAQIESGSFNGGPQLARGKAWLELARVRLGAEAFRRGLHEYLVAHAGGTATSTDLAAALAHASLAPMQSELVALFDHPLPRVHADLVCDAGRPPVVKLQPRHASHAPVHACVSFEQAGKRSSECGDIVGPGLDLVLPSTTCPRWILANSDGRGLYALDWDAAAVGTLVKTAWPALTADERTLVFAEATYDDVDRVLAFTQLVADHRDTIFAGELDFVSRQARYVPATLRRSFDAWVRTRYARFAQLDLARVGHADFGPDAWLAALALIRAGDPQLGASARRVIAAVHDQPNGLADLLAPTVAETDSAFAEEWLTASSLESRERSRRVLAVGRMPGGAAVIAKHAELLATFEDRQLGLVFRDVCDETDRAELAKLLAGKQATELFERIDHCIADRKQLEPAFRAWLAPPKPHK